MSEETRSAVMRLPDDLLCVVVEPVYGLPDASEAGLGVEPTIYPDIAVNDIQSLITDLEAKLAEVEKERDAYAAMLGEANHIELRYSPACDSVRILVHRRAGKAFLHYRDREGNWLNDHEVDTDFTGNRKVKEFDTVLEAYANLKEK